MSKQNARIGFGERLAAGLQFMSPAFSPELQLAVACAMWPQSFRRTEAIRAAACQPLDWHRFLRVARRNDLIGLVHDGVAQARLKLPQDIVKELSSHAAMLTRESLAIAHESWRLQRLFEDAQLPVLFLKGTSLAMLAFKNLGLRSSQDIDLLVSYEALPAATALMLRAGYRRFDPPPDLSETQLDLVMRLRKDFGFVHQMTGLRVEVHWRLFLNRYTMPEDSIMTFSQVVSLTGAIGLRSLGEEDLFSYLCIHGALHWWSRLKWLADINALSSERDIERLFRAAEDRGAGRAAAQGLSLCRRLFGTPLPAGLMAILINKPTVRWLEATALSAIAAGGGEADHHESRFGTTRGSFSTFLLRRNWRYRLAEWSIHLINQTDVLILPLPKLLRFLYPLLRVPLWVWRHAGKQGPCR